jgi:molybdopterin converting factor subunit 1
MKVLLFARAKDIVGADRIDVPLPASATVAELRQALERAYPALGPLLGKSALAVNGEFAQEQTLVPANAEVALVPPVSGG